MYFHFVPLVQPCDCISGYYLAVQTPLEWFRSSAPRHSATYTRNDLQVTTKYKLRSCTWSAEANGPLFSSQDIGAAGCPSL
jgi:hypothetical protein